MFFWCHSTSAVNFIYKCVCVCACIYVCVCVQTVRLSDHRGRLYFAGLSCELQPLPSERAWPELQSSRRLRSEAARVFQVWTDNKNKHTGSLSHWQAEDCWSTVWTSSTADNSEDSTRLDCSLACQASGASCRDSESRAIVDSPMDIML